jgi:hypothetical protein
MVLDHHRTLAEAVIGGSRICGESRDSNSGFQSAVGSAVNYAQENTKRWVSVFASRRVDRMSTERKDCRHLIHARDLLT